MKKRKITPFAATVVIWAICVIGIVLYVTVHPCVKYIEISTEPQIIYVEVEKKVEPEEQSYYAKIADTITDEEITLLAKLVYEEARGESILGQRVVVSVVLNRVLDDRFPDTIHEVIYQTGQFSPAYKLKNTTPTKTQYDVVKMVLSETNPLIPANVVYFSTSPIGNTIYEKIGEHYFCS